MVDNTNYRTEGLPGPQHPDGSKYSGYDVPGYKKALDYEREKYNARDFNPKDIIAPAARSLRKLIPPARVQ